MAHSHVRSSDTYVGRAASSWSSASLTSPSDPSVNIVLIGPPGDGKSTLGNLLVRGTDVNMWGRAPFRASEDFNSVNVDIAHSDFEYERVHHRIIDTTGLFEGATNAVDRLVSCAKLSPGGVDAFVFVIRKGRFTEEYFDQLRSFEEAAGTGSLGRTLIVFSHCGRETNEQLLNRCRRSGNAHLREALQRTAGVVGVDCHTHARASDDRGTVLAAIARICRDHRDVPKLTPMDPAELRRQLSELESAIGRLSYERQDALKDKMHGVKSGCASLAALRTALTEADAQQGIDDGRAQESRALQNSVAEAKQQAGAMRQAANSLVERANEPRPDHSFACCTPSAACTDACAPCEGGLKDIIQQLNQDRQQNIQAQFAQADLVADLAANR